MKTQFNYVYHNFDKVLGKIIRHHQWYADDEEWYLIIWPDDSLQWLCNSRDFIRDDIIFLEDMDEKKRLELLIRLK
jgi:hypothetical protein